MRSLPAVARSRVTSLALRCLIGVCLANFVAPQPSFALIKLEWDCKNQETGDTCMRHGGLKSIYIFDEIEFADADAIARIDNTLYVDQAFPKIYINSPGGNVAAGQQIGRILRRRKASIEGKNYYFPTRPARCDSSCVFIAAGAVDRQFDEIGVHRSFAMKATSPCKIERAELSDGDVDQHFEFYREMGLPEQFREYAVTTPSREVTEFYHDPEIPDDEQMIVKFGFHMHPNEPGHPVMFDKTGEPRFSKTVSDLETAANEGNAKAAATLGRIYQKGKRGLSTDMPKAVNWYERAGALGEDTALHALGVIYDNGIGVKKDLRRAADYYQQAASHGLAASQNNLGWMYYKGDGVPRDYGLAIYWLTRSADQGEGFAYGSIGEMTLHGRGFPRDNIEAYKWLYLAEQNMPTGKSWDLNHAMLKKLKGEMTVDQVYTAELRASNWRPLKMADHRMADKCLVEKD